MSEYINNYSQRKAKIKEALEQIHEGKPYEEVKAIFAEVLSQATAQEIAEIEEALIAEGLPVEDIQYLCDVHVAMFRESLDHQQLPQMIAGHPLYTFNAENELANLQLNDCRKLLDQAKNDPTAENFERLHAAISKLKTYDHHYLRKENILFPYLEKYGFTGPSSVMWGIHDEIRKAWKDMLKLFREKSSDKSKTVTDVEKLFTPMENALREMVYKEERILFPNALERLTEDDWIAVHSQENEFGFSFVTRGKDWPGEISDKRINEINDGKESDDERINHMNKFPLQTGDLTLSQINLLLTHLPVDITFVDEHDTVRYFSETPERIFPRTAAIIGRKVQNCHPPASVDKVVEIVEDFRTGKRDTAEFWIQMDGKFIHIRYFAMRDAQGEYRGTLEVSQDLAELRKLEGEKRLIDG